MSTNISKICNQQSIELNTDKLSNQNISENKGSTTNIGDNINQAKSLSSAQQNALNHIGKVLEKTYHLNSSDVDNIKAFVSALDKQINEQIEKQSVTGVAESWGSGGAGIVENLKAELKSSEKLQKNIDACMNAKTSFFTQLKFLCAKIASFFGNNSKLEKLQEKGLEQFNELRGLLTKNLHGKNFLISFLEGNSSNKEAIVGMFKCLFGISINKNDSDVAKNVTGLKEILESNKSEEILGLIDEAKSLKIDKLSIKVQQMLCCELEKLTIENCKNASIAKNITALLRGTNFCNFDLTGIDTNKAQFYSSSLGQFAGRFGSFLDDFKKLSDDDLREKFNEFKSVLDSTKVNYKLMNSIKDGTSMQGLTRTEFIAAARKSLGDKKFLSQFKSEIANGSLIVNDKLSEKFVSQFKSEILDGSLKIRDEHLLKYFAKAVLWADRDDVEAGLKSSLERSNMRGSKDIVFEDVARGYSYSFRIGGETILLNKTKLFEDLRNELGNLSLKQREEILKNGLGVLTAKQQKQFFENGIENLSPEQQEKIKEFCANFPSQGCFACSIPIAGDGCPTFEVNFDKNDTIVTCKTKGENSNWGNFGAMLARENFSVWEKVKKYEPVLKVSCEFSFTYKGGIGKCKGKASDISVQKYEQSITFAE